MATLAQQKMCANQAREFFNESDTRKLPKTTTAVVPASYVDHYDAKVNICYVAIVRTESANGGKTLDYRTAVFDAFEQTSYALYFTTSDRVKNYSEAKPPVWCTVEPRGQREITCKSEGEFNRLLEKYFGLVVQ